MNQRWTLRNISALSGSLRCRPGLLDELQHSGLESAEICELDADGPLLDSTMALYGSGMAFGHSHGSANLPLTLACGGGLGIRHGRHVDFNAQSKAEGYTYDLDNHAKHDAICHSRLVTLRAKVRRS